MNVLVGDLGGTKTILGVVSTQDGPHKLLCERTYPSAHFNCLEAIIREFLDEIPLQINRACLAVAGPITGRKTSITNLSWLVDADQLQSTFNLSAVIEVENRRQAVSFARQNAIEQQIYGAIDNKS